MIASAPIPPATGKVRAWLSLGSNLGNRRQHLASGIRHLEATSGIEIAVLSPVYETMPWGIAEQPAFLNLCVGIDTSLSPRDLLSACLAAEKAQGRVRELRWGPRVLDVDILLFGDREIDEDGLTIPHPHMLERAFVLRPLMDIAPGMMLKGASIKTWLDQIDAGGMVNIGGLFHG